MKSNGATDGFILRSGRGELNRRVFFAKGLGGAVGWMLLAPPRAGISGTQQGTSREELFLQLDAKAEGYFTRYGSCAMSSFAALNEQFGLKYDALVPALMPFTGGIASKGETCGAVSGSLLALGIFFSSSVPKDNRPPGSLMKLGGLFVNGFEKEFGSTRCREVVRHQYGRYFNFSDPEDLKLYMELSKKGNRCADVVKKAARLAAAVFMDQAV